MVLRELGPAAQALRLAELACAVRVLARYSTDTHSASVIIRSSPARRPWREVEGADELSHFVMLAVGCYGQSELACSASHREALASPSSANLNRRTHRLFAAYLLHCPPRQWG